MNSVAAITRRSLASTALSVAWPAPRERATILWFAFLTVCAANLNGLGIPGLGVTMLATLRFVLCIASGAYGLFYFRETWAQFNRFPYAWAFLFAVWVSASAVLTGNWYAAVCSSTLWCQVLFAPIALRQMGGRRVFLTTICALSTFLVGCWLAHALVPEYRNWELTSDGGYTNRLSGLAHPNDVGCVAALLTTLLLLALSRGLIRQRYLAVGLILCVASLFYAGSRTALLSLGPIALLMGVRHFGRRSMLLVGFCGLLAVVAVGFVTESLSLEFSPDRWATVLSRSGDADEIYSFTGRMDVWKFAIVQIETSPVCGAGFGCARFAIGEMNGWTPGHAHNLLLNITMSTGMFGGVLVATILLTQIVQCFRRPDWFPDLVVLLIFFNGLTESSLFSHSLDALTLILLVTLCWRQQGATLSELNCQLEMV